MEDILKDILDKVLQNERRLILIQTYMIRKDDTDPEVRRFLDTGEPTKRQE